jgi:hypothetical protein
LEQGSHGRIVAAAHGEQQRLAAVGVDVRFVLHEPIEKRLDLSLQGLAHARLVLVCKLLERRATLQRAGFANRIHMLLEPWNCEEIFQRNRRQVRDVGALLLGNQDLPHFRAHVIRDEVQQRLAPRELLQRVFHGNQAPRPVEMSAVSGSFSKSHSDTSCVHQSSGNPGSQLPGVHGVGDAARAAWAGGAAGGLAALV